MLLQLCSHIITISGQKQTFCIVCKCCYVLFIFPLLFTSLALCMCVQDYSEEFRDISSKGKRSGHIPEGAITLLNQRTVGDDLPVMIFTVSITVTLSPIMIHHFYSYSGHFKFLNSSLTLLKILLRVYFI